jgi:arginine deiminase
VPNLFFTRDVGIIVDEHVVIGSMRHGARWSEELLVKALAYHPSSKAPGSCTTGPRSSGSIYTLEGGDVHPVRRDTVLLGFSDRSSPPPSITCAPGRSSRRP